MMEDVDIFAEYAYGKAALAKIQPTHPDFRLYCAGFMDDKNDCMQLKGAVFRRLTRGPRKGELAGKVRGTEVTVYVTAVEIKAFESQPPPKE